MKINNVIKVEVSNIEIEQLVIEYIRNHTEVGDTVPTITVDDNGITALFEVITIPTTTDSTDKPKRGRPKKETDIPVPDQPTNSDAVESAESQEEDTETFLSMIMADENITPTQSPFAPATNTLDFSKLMG